MASTNQLNYGWLGDLTNPNHDGTTQQIDDFAQAYVTDNAVFNQKKAALHQARQNEDDVWIKSQRDPAVKRLEDADKKQDAYEMAGHYVLVAHAQLPDDEPTKAEAEVCEQIIKDAGFRTKDSYSVESDKVIQIHQQLQSHQEFLTQIGAWTFFTKSLAAAQLVREILGERAKTKGEFVKGEMKAARKATDQAIADLYSVIDSMMVLIPSPELTALYNQLKGIELYARQYYIKDGGGASNDNDNPNDNNGGGGDDNGGGDTPTPNPNPDPNPDPNSGGGDNNGGGGGDDGSDED